MKQITCWCPLQAARFQLKEKKKKKIQCNLGEDWMQAQNSMKNITPELYDMSMHYLLWSAQQVSSSFLVHALVWLKCFIPTFQEQT